MEIILKRTMRKGNRVAGELAIDGMKIADTAENLAHMLPEGNYEMGIETVRRQHRKMPFITNGKAKRHVSFGNGVYGSFARCVNVGKTICPGYLKNTRETFNRLYQRLRKTIERGNRVTVRIVSNDI